MRQKQRKVVFAFESTTMAMKMEKVMKEEGAPGRLIPVPKEITAGCGLSYIVEPERREEIESLMAAHGIEAQAEIELML